MDTYSHWPEADGRSAVLSGFTRTVTHDLGVDCAAHTVQQLGIQLGESIH